MKNKIIKRGEKMEKKFEEYKVKVENLFEQPRFIILSQIKGIDERKKTEMTLKIIKAVVVRFIKTIFIKKKNIILCTSNKEIIDYVRIGLLRYLAEEDRVNREFIEKTVEKLKVLLEEVNRYNTYEEVV